jgi:hypothetical protein
MYANGKMRPVITTPGMQEGGDKRDEPIQVTMHMCMESLCIAILISN